MFGRFLYCQLLVFHGITCCVAHLYGGNDCIHAAEVNYPFDRISCNNIFIPGDTLSKACIVSLLNR
jgi:hypothetical protein